MKDSNTAAANEVIWTDRWPHAQLKWSPAYRVIPTRHPAINLFDRVASSNDFEALYALEAMTNDRLRTEIGELDLVPKDERRFGVGYGPIMAAFTHLNPGGSRFSDGTYGVFYCARSRRTAIEETRFHSALFLAHTNEPPMRQQMRLYSVQADGNVLDIRGDLASRQFDAVLSKTSYAAGQALGREARAANVPGIVYPSVRDKGGDCLSAFRTTLLHDCRHAAFLEYEWNGETVAHVYEMNKVG